MVVLPPVLHSVSEIGNYTITVTDIFGCVDSSSLIITEPFPITAPPLTSTPDTNNTGLGTATISSVNGGTPPYTYNWLPSGGTGSTAIGLTAGTYTVTVSDSNGCSYVDTVNVSNVNIISIFEINSDMKFDIYPNPNKGQFIVEITNAKNKDYLIEVRNIISQIVYAEQIYPPAGGGKLTKEIDLSEQGAYFISISNSSGTRTKKLIVY